MFVERSYTETSMRDAAKMNTKAASLYAHINSKKEIPGGFVRMFFNRIYTNLKNLEQAQMPEGQRFAEFIMLYITETLWILISLKSS